MSRSFTHALVGLLVALAAAGCGARQDQAGDTPSTSRDTLLAGTPAPGSDAPDASINPTLPVETPASPPPATAPPRTTPGASKPAAPKPAPGVTIPAGTALEVTLEAELSSEFAKAGDPWTGTVKEPLVVGTAAPVPAGSRAHGTVLAVRAAEKGKRAYVVLRLDRIEADGRTLGLKATTDTLWAGSTTTRDVGAVAGGAAVGALIGKVVGGNTGAVVGGVAGGTAAGVGVVTAKGYQSRIEPDKPVAFHVREEQVVR